MQFISSSQHKGVILFVCSLAKEGGLTLELSIAQFWSSGIASHEPTCVDFEIAFHGICIDQKVIALDGSESPLRIVARSLLASERLVPVATLNKIKMPYRPVESNLRSLPTSRDRLPSGKQIIALTLTYKFKLEDSAEIKPHVPLLNNRIYDNKFESQFYRISDSNKCVYSSGDVYPSYVKLSKGEYTLQLYIREPEAFYVGPPSREKLPKIAPPGSVLVGSITYGAVSSFSKKDDQNQHAPASYSISFIIPPSKVDDDQEKGVSVGKKSISERLDEEVRDTKIKFLFSLKQESDDDKSAWLELVASLKSEYPKYTPLLTKILECVLQKTTGDDKIGHQKEAMALLALSPPLCSRSRLSRNLAVAVAAAPAKLVLPGVHAAR
ncbi:hypothetical protein EJB05_20346, partial [Eragrostis curvula]